MSWVVASAGNASAPRADDPAVAVRFAMKFAPPLSHEIRYVFSVHGGILIPGVAMLLRKCSPHDPSSGWNLIAPVIVVRSGSRVVASPRRSGIGEAIVPGTSGTYDANATASPEG
jgi:hypothetical protein